MFAFAQIQKLACSVCSCKCIPVGNMEMLIIIACHKSKGIELCARLGARFTHFLTQPRLGQRLSLKVIWFGFGQAISCWFSSSCCCVKPFASC